MSILSSTGSIRGETFEKNNTFSSVIESLTLNWHLDNKFNLKTTFIALIFDNSVADIAKEGVKMPADKQKRRKKLI